MKNNEKFFLAEQERQKREKTKAEKLKIEEDFLRAKKSKEYVHEEEEVESDLQKLKNLLEEHIIDDTLIEKVIAKTEIDHEDIEEIFEKIDEIEALENIDDYLPKDKRITKEEYAHATHDDAAARIVIQKIEWCLSVLAAQANPGSLWGSINIFSGFLTILDKNLITIQEHHIDMKDSLTSAPKTKGIWQSVKDGFMNS